MAIKESFLPEFEREMETTRLVLDRVPDAAAQWNPHAKSRSLGDLSSHLADVPRFVPRILTTESFDAAPPGAEPYKVPRFDTTEKLVARFKENVDKAHAAIEAVPGDADFMVPWTLKRGGKAFFTVPRAAALRTFLLNHMIHHRGQLTVYLRLQDVPLPSVYGPTADQA